MKNKSIFSSKTVPALILLLVPLVIYSISLTFGFVFDDIKQVLENPWLTDLRHIPDILSSSVGGFRGKGVSNTYRPLFMLALMAEQQVFGFKAWGFHLVSVILHSLNTLMVFLVASFFFSKDALLAGRSSGGNLKTSHIPAFLAGLVFALHTINTEPVVWISAISELVFTLLLLVSFYLYIKHEEGARIALPVSVLSFFLALFTKETAIVLVLLIPAYEFSSHGRALFKRWKAYIPYLAATAVYMAIRTSVVGVGLHNKFVDLSVWESLINIFPLIARYFAKLILPLGLSAIYPIPPVHSITEPMAITGVIASGLFLGALLVFRKNRVVFFGLLWILIPLLPVMYIPAIPISSMADRYLYMSTIGFAMLAAYLAGYLFLRARPAGYGRLVVVALTAAVLVGYSVLTITSSLAWKNDRTVWTNAAGKFPESAYAHLKLALELQKMGEIDSAMTHYKEVIRYREAINFEVDKDKADYNLAVIYHERGDHANAIIHYKEVIRLATDKNTAAAHYNMAILYHKRGEHAGAIIHYNEALRIKPDYKDAYYNLAILYHERGEHADAIIHYREAIRLGTDEDKIAAHYNMGLIYAGQGLLGNALKEFKAVLAIDPSYGEARAQLDRVIRLRGSEE